MRSPALKIVLIYVVFGCLWILFSDHLLGLWVEDAREMQRLQTYKGWAFVVISGGVFFYLIHRAFHQVESARGRLDRSMQHYSNLFLHNPQVMWVVEEQSGRILEANEAACRDYGYTPEEFTRLNLQDLMLVEPEDLSEIIPDANLEEEPFRHLKDIRHVKRDGHIIDVEMLVHPLPELDQPRSYMVSARDVSERKKAFASLRKSEQALQESERQLSTLISNLPGMVFRCMNDEHWTMLFVGGAAEELTGYRPMELTGNRLKFFASIIHPEDRATVWANTQKMVPSGSGYTNEYRIITSRGEVRYVWEQAQGVYDASGELLYLEGFISDITKQRDTENALQYHGDFLLNILNNIPFPLFYKDLQGKFLGCNMHFCEYLGLDYDQIIGKTPHELFSSPVGFYDAGDQELLESGEPQKYETSIMFPDGKMMDAVFHKSVFHDPDGKPAGIIGVYFDISDRMRAELTIKKQVDELERINRELERFTYTVSHDLRSPLVTIKGFLGMLREDAQAGDHEQMEMDIQRISNAADKMHFLLEDLLQLSRIGRVGNPFTHFSMTEAAREVREYLDGIIPGPQCQVNIQPGMPDVYGDRTRVMEVLQNLLENAIKFKNPQVDLVVDIGVEYREEVPVFFVKDNGMGIEKNYHKKIFGLFNKLDPHTSGTGIGLALVQRIIEFHGGDVWVESEGKGMGTGFYFTLQESIKS